MESNPKTPAEVAFELAQREATALVKANLLPEALNNVAGAMQVIAMAKSSGIPIFLLAQNVYVVHGRVGLSAVFLVGHANTSPKMEHNLRFEIEGKWPEITATAIGRLAGDPEGTQRTVSISMADAREQGWTKKDKNGGSKYNSQLSATHMLKYRAGTWWVRENMPEMALGLRTVDELIDIGAAEPIPNARPTAAPLPETHQIAEAPSIDDFDAQAELDRRAQREPAPREDAKAEAAHDGDLSPEDRLRAEIEELEEAEGVMPDERGRFRGDHGLAVPFNRATMEQLRAYKARIFGGAK